MDYQGDYAEDATVYVMFNTFTSDDPSASSTITNFINTDVHIHKDDGLTQRNNAAGITVSVDFDGITGSHMIKIDTSDDTVGGFWVKGNDYFVRIEGTTIDGATVNVVVGHFSIENRFNQTVVPDVAGTAPTAVEIQAEMEENGASVLDTIRDDLDNATDGLGALKALIDAIPTTAMRGTDDAALASGVDITHIMGTILTEGGAGRLAAAFIKLFDVVTPLLVASDVMRGTDGANTTTPPTVAEIQTEMEEDSASLLDTIRDELANETDGLSALKALIDAIPTTAMRGTDNAALASVCTEARLAELAAANLPTNVDTLLTRITAAVALASVCTEARLAELDAANLPANIDTITGYLDTEIAAIITHLTDIKGAGWTDENLKDIDALIDAIKAKTDNQPAGVPKNVAWSNFEFLMVDSTNHITPKTGLTVTAQISKDGGAFAGSTNSAAEVANGVYKINWTQAEMNADDITFKLTATGADQRTITIKTST